MGKQLSKEKIRRTANELHSIAIHLLRGLQKVDAESGLSRARLSALSVVVFAGPLRVSKLAQIEGVKPPTMTVLVRGLEEEGLVKRESDPNDARASLVSATDGGLRVIEETRARRLQAIETRLTELTSRQKTLVEEAVSILAGIYAPQGPPPPPEQPTHRISVGGPSTSPRQPETVREKPHKRRSE